jgi:hypothetical protein
MISSLFLSKKLVVKHTYGIFQSSIMRLIEYQSRFIGLMDHRDLQRLKLIAIHEGYCQSVAIGFV